jgi:hypothetical protein
MGNVFTEEKAIIHAQYLDLVYSLSDTIYGIIPHPPLPSNDPTRLSLEPGFVSYTKSISAPSQTFELNAIQSTSSQQLGGKKKNKGKPKKSSNEHDNPNIVDTQLNRKVKFPCMICEEYHYMKYFPHHEVVAKFLKGISQMVQRQNMVT